MSKNRTIALAAPSVGNAEWQALRAPIEAGWLTQGPQVAAFEADFAKRHGVGHALATTSGTTALHLALAALGIGAGDEVVVPSFTWVATANAVVQTGATPVFADVDRRTFNVDVADLKRRLTERCKAVMPVHLFGLCADIEAVRAAVPSEVHIVEDAACAAGAEQNGVPAGALGDIGCFSFHPRKSITTGEGGMVTTDDDGLAAAMVALRNHGATAVQPGNGKPHPYDLPEFDVAGFNYRMSDLQAAIGRVQLERLDNFIDERRRWAAYYGERLGDIEWLRLPAEPGNGHHAWQSFVVMVDPDKAPAPRNSIMDALMDRGIATRPGTHAVHMLGYYRARFGIEPDDYPAARDCDRNSMAIPLHNGMVEDDYAYVVDNLRAL